MKLPQPLDLDGLKAKAKVRIDAEAEVARARFITPGAGQAMAYAAKLAEAEAVMAGRHSAVPFIAAEAEASGRPLDQVAQDILARDRETAGALAAIEAMRLAAKRAVEAASSPAAIRAAAAVEWKGTS